MVISTSQARGKKSHHHHHHHSLVAWRMCRSALIWPQWVAGPGISWISCRRTAACRYSFFWSSTWVCSQNLFDFQSVISLPVTKQSESPHTPFKTRSYPLYPLFRLHKLKGSKTANRNKYVTNYTHADRLQTEKKHPFTNGNSRNTTGACKKMEWEWGAISFLMYVLAGAHCWNLRLDCTWPAERKRESVQEWEGRNCKGGKQEDFRP